MVHKVPGSEKWELAKRSHELWEKFAEDIKYQGMDPQEVFGWKKTGTLHIYIPNTPMSSHFQRVFKKFDKLSNSNTFPVH